MPTCNGFFCSKLPKTFSTTINRSKYKETNKNHHLKTLNTKQIDTVFLKAAVIDKHQIPLRFTRFMFRVRSE